MRADFSNGVARTLDIKRNDLIEKDIILHQILTDLSKDGFFSKNFIFKGGTCLIKSYFGYVRFSEDIDFTWKNQKVFEGKSQSKIRDYLSGVIDETGKVFENIAAKRGLEFKCHKSNRDFVELGGSNKNCTFKVWYTSDILKKRSFVKVQINFVEQMCFRPTRGNLNSLITGKHDELDALFTEYREYATPVTFGIYDIREILSEKVRALLTREGTKARDFLDVYLIFKRFKIKPEDLEACILNKMKFTLRLYNKYRSNLKEKTTLLNSGKIFDWGREKELLLSEIDETDFYSFLNGFQTFLQGIVQAVDRAAELKEAPKEDVAFIAKELANPRNAETQQAAWLELDTLAKSTRLWKHKAIWGLLDTSILTDKPGPQTRTILGLLRALLYNAERDLGKKNAVAKMARQAYRKRLEEILGNTDSAWRDARFDVISLLDYLASDQEKFDACWKSWEKAAKEIKDQEQYTQFLQPFISYLTSVNPKLKKPVRTKLYRLMQAPEPDVRKRASEMHRYLFSQ